MAGDQRDIALKWLAGGDTGQSSKAICFHMTGTPCRYWDHPSDPDDLGRCLRLLDLIPEWKVRLPEMATRGPGWAGLVAHWSEIDAMMREEVGVDWKRGRNAERTYWAMKVAIAEGYRNDPSYECQFRPDGTLRSYSKKGGGDSMFSLGGGARVRTR